MSDFYTSVHVNKGRILYRGVRDGKRIQERFNYAPTLFVHSDKITPYKSISGTPLQPIQFKSISEAKKYIYGIGEETGTQIYGMRRFEYSFIEETPPIDWKVDLIRVARLDIEVKSADGFPYAEIADQEVTVITLKIDGHFFVFGVGPYNNTRKDVSYFECRDEKHLFNMFMAFWENNYPDILTGWNISRFDVTYLVNRMNKIMGEDFTNKLSPWKVLRPINIRDDNYTSPSYSILGVAVLDSMDMYKKYVPHGASQDSYKLDSIGEVEKLGKKLDYSEFGSLEELRKNNFQKYVDYNIQDVELDDKISNKYDILTLVITVAYMNNVNFEDVFTQVRMWAAIVDREYRKIGILLNHGKKHVKTSYAGGFVLDPQIGAFEDVVSFDLTSLYPHLIMQYNISPETLIEPHHYTEGMRRFLQQPIDIDTIIDRKIDTEYLYREGVTATPNLQLFRIDKQGVLPRIMEEMFIARNDAKKKQKEMEKLAENAKTEKTRKKYTEEAGKYKSLQMALKVCLNSAYGATGSEFFVLFDERIAGAITSTGRLAVQWIGKKTNDYLNDVLGTSKDYIIAQDTDSMYITLKSLVDKSFDGKEISLKERIDFIDKICDGPIQKMLDKGFNELKVYLNAYSQKMFMKREAIASKAFWTGKKRYAMAVWDMEGVRYHRAHIKITGLEAIRSTTPPKARKALKVLCGILLKRDRKYAQKFIERFHQKFPSYPLNEIAVTTGVKGIETYAMDRNGDFRSGTPMHVRASLVYNNFISKNNLEKKYDKIKNGAKIRYIPLKLPNPTMNTVFAWETFIPEELDYQKYIDYEGLYQKTFRKAVERIMKVHGWDVENFVTLEDFLV